MEDTYKIPKLETKRLLLKKLDFHDLDDLFEVYWILKQLYMYLERYTKIKMKLVFF